MAEARRRRDEAKTSEFKHWNRTEVDTSKVVVPPPPATILDECPRFRVLIIGRSGVGKSTICSLVFGITDFRRTGISHHSRGIHDVNDEVTFPDINPRIGIHDAPGFEAGDNKIYETVKAFIKKRRSADKLADQVHCIWYCISCDDLARPSQECEEDFFGNLEKIAGKIPVIVVFTKFDKVINSARGKYVGKNFRKISTGEISEETMIQEVQTIANGDYENGRRELAKVIPKIGTGIIRISNPSGEELDDGLLAMCPDIGVDALTKMTFEHLENHAIRVLWAAAQNNSADLKVASSVTLGLKHFEVSLGISAIPFVPVVSAVTFWCTFTYCFDEISNVWKLKDRHQLLKQRYTKRKFLEAIFDLNPYVFLALQAIDILGPTDAPATASVLAKVIAGITLMHDNLFMRELQQRRDGTMVTSLTSDDIDQTVKAFRIGELRSHMRTYINGSSLFTKAYSRNQIGNLIEEAIGVARGKVPRESLERVYT